MFILASASPRRRELLAQIGINPKAVIAPNIDEACLPNESPRHYALRIATKKAESVALQHPHCFILSADTVVACSRVILHKTEDPGHAYEYLCRLSGRRHVVWGGICLIDSKGRKTKKIVKTTIKFRNLTKEEIKSYISSQEWIGKAGAYAIQGRAASYVEYISGCYFNIVGLSLSAIYPWLRHHSIIS